MQQRQGRVPIMSIVWGLGVSAQRGAQRGRGERQRGPGLERGGTRTGPACDRHLTGMAAFGDLSRKWGVSECK